MATHRPYNRHEQQKELDRQEREFYADPQVRPKTFNLRPEDQRLRDFADQLKLIPDACQMYLEFEQDEEER